MSAECYLQTQLNSRDLKTVVGLMFYNVTCQVSQRCIFKQIMEMNYVKQVFQKTTSTIRLFGGQM